MYYASLITSTLFFIQSKFSTQSDEKAGPVDILAIPTNVIPPLIGRGTMGFFSDIFTFLAYNYTSYSKAQAIFFTNTLMIPFFALCILKEPLRK